MQDHLHTNLENSDHSHAEAEAPVSSKRQEQLRTAQHHQRLHRKRKLEYVQTLETDISDLRTKLAASQKQSFSKEAEIAQLKSAFQLHLINCTQNQHTQIPARCAGCDSAKLRVESLNKQVKILTNIISMLQISNLQTAVAGNVWPLKDSISSNSASINIPIVPSQWSFELNSIGLLPDFLLTASPPSSHTSPPLHLEMNIPEFENSNTQWLNSLPRPTTPLYKTPTDLERVASAVELYGPLDVGFWRILLLSLPSYKKYPKYAHELVDNFVAQAKCTTVESIKKQLLKMSRISGPLLRIMSREEKIMASNIFLLLMKRNKNHFMYLTGEVSDSPFFGYQIKTPKNSDVSFAPDIQILKEGLENLPSLRESLVEIYHACSLYQLYRKSPESITEDSLAEMSFLEFRLKSRLDKLEEMEKFKLFFDVHETGRKFFDRAAANKLLELNAESPPTSFEFA
ncbi:hypothetical protein HK100_008772 [Physocladia obscura]|uniref:BZIP domain-containing protein n=1 Tax=Physocladia obscura TaxID=109957 RepID=A0AAD5XHW1_9FUNG|nr:hypothetical protein HK100_008772 [Physocladia obscura]